MIFVQPTGREVDTAHVPELDDALFTSDPYSHFLAQIEAITADESSDPYSSSLAGELCKVLHRPAAQMPTASERARGLRRALDALTLRQNLAETVVRMWLATLEASAHPTGTASVWATLTDEPVQVADCLRQIAEHSGNQDPEMILQLLVPERLISEVQPGSAFAAAVDTMCDWMRHAEALITRSDICLHAAYNKAKHGLAVRARDDVRLEFLAADAIPEGASGRVPLSAFESAIPVIDQPCILYLVRPPKGASGHKECLEMTCLRLDVATTLAECFMLATTHAAIFHSAASRYEAWRGVELGIAPYPRLSSGPTPQQLLGTAVTGLRAAITFRPDGSPSERTPGIGFSNGVFQPISVGAPLPGVVIEG